MSYLLDKKIQQKKFLKIGIGILLLIIFFYFRAGIFRGLSSVGGGVFRPVILAGKSVGNKFKNFGAYFVSKNSLSLENENLKSKIIASEADRANYSSVVAENTSLKEILGRKNAEKTLTVAAIIAKPNQSPYDTLVIDAGTAQEIKIGDMVFALGDLPIGRVAEVSPRSAKVILFSTSGEKTPVVISSVDVSLELVGRGGGNFEMIIPRDFNLQKGDPVLLPGLAPYVLAIVETIISDPRDPLTKALLVAPVNIQELKFVEIQTAP